MKGLYGIFVLKPIDIENICSSEKCLYHRYCMWSDLVETKETCGHGIITMEDV